MPRERSFWGWGWADKLPDHEMRRAMAARVGAFFGQAPPELRQIPSIDDVALPAARVVPELGFCTCDPRERIFHTHGKNYRDLVRAFQGDFSRAPDVVAFPNDEGQVAEVLAWCAARGLAAIPYGGGTSVVGGVQPDPADVRDGLAGVCTIDLRAMRRVLEVDRISRGARIQAGALGPDIEEQLSPHGLTLRHYPQSFEFSTLGGWIATRAGGHFATLYTHIDDLVESVRMVTPAGVFATRRLPASGAGPSPERLVLGSEGTLGVITEAWMRVQERPNWRASASVSFPKFEHAVEGARRLAQSGLFPTNCRVLDAREAMLNHVAFDGSSVLIVAFESADHPLEAWMERALAIVHEAGGTCARGAVYKEAGAKVGAGEAASSWRQAFLDAPYMQSALVSLGVVVDTFETACTWDRFAALHAEVTRAAEDAMARACGGGILSCRFTHVYPDGPAPYFTFLAPGRVGREIEQWMAIKSAVSDALEAAGGTITHHHAVGRLHRPWYQREGSPIFLRAMDAVKGELDPRRILNPGVLVEAGPGAGATGAGDDACLIAP
jgi:alkyldihydroxyacetonephosphate synthase